MNTYKQCTYLKHYRSQSEDHWVSEFITCNMHYPLKSREWGRLKGVKLQGLQIIKIKI